MDCECPLYSDSEMFSLESEVHHYIEILEPVLRDAGQEMWQALDNTEALVAHNAGFDISVLKACLERADLYARLPESFCTCRLSRKWVKGLPNYKLNTLCDHFGIALNHHEALSDARGAAKIMIELSKLSLFHDFFPH